MGIILLPILFITFIIWLICLVKLIVLIKNKRIKNLIGVFIAPIISCTIYLLILWDWSKQEEIWALQPFITLPIALIAVPGLIGNILISGLEDNKWWNIVTVSICFSTIISGIAIVIIPSLTQANTFLEITLKY